MFQCVFFTLVCFEQEQRSPPTPSRRRTASPPSPELDRGKGVHTDAAGILFLFPAPIVPASGFDKSCIHFLRGGELRGMSSRGILP